jgi:hypothetical protein
MQEYALRSASLRCASPFPRDEGNNQKAPSDACVVTSFGSGQEQAGVIDNQFGEPCAKADLFFLYDSLAYGMSFTEAAGFLCRTKDKVRAKRRQILAKGHRLRSRSSRPWPRELHQCTALGQKIAGLDLGAIFLT